MKTVDLWYPRNEGNADSIRISLVDVRAANDLIVRYDFERDGWVVMMPSKFRWDADDPDPSDDQQEVAFIAAWATGLPDED